MLRSMQAIWQAGNPVPRTGMKASVVATLAECSAWYLDVLGTSWYMVFRLQLVVRPLCMPLFEETGI